MGISSPLIGRLIDRSGGRRVMIAGSVLIALGCTSLAVAHSLSVYLAAWLCLGIAMRCTLYDAAFAALARIGGASARRGMAQITLMGGLASSVFWPLGDHLARDFGWRGAVFVYAALALLTIPVHAAIPDAADIAAGSAPDTEPLATSGRRFWLAAGLYAAMTSLTSALNAAMSAHMIGLLAGMGLATSAAVWIASARGIGQSLARLAEVIFGGRLHPLDLNLATMLVLPFCFIAALFGEFMAPALAFAFFYGASNGIATITRGTLVLFDARGYGARTGRLLAPSFILSAASPVAYAFVMAQLGARAALHVSIGIAAVILVAAAALKFLFRRHGGFAQACNQCGCCPTPLAPSGQGL